MKLFEIVKYGVNCREAAERYGVEVNHCGMALCPFHNDRHPSLYVADDHYYTDLKEQTAEFDPDELQDARLALRPVMERSAVDRVQSAYGNKYDPLIMYDSKWDVADLLHEHEERRSVREFLRQQQTAQTTRHRKEKQQER